MVTGGTVGIGFEVAKALAFAKARVILLSRGQDNAEEAISNIKASQSASGGLVDVTWVSCDLGSLTQVRKIGDQLRKQEERLDLVRCQPDHSAGYMRIDHADIPRSFSASPALVSTSTTSPRTASTAISQ